MFTTLMELKVFFWIRNLKCLKVGCERSTFLKSYILKLCTNLVNMEGCAVIIFKMTWYVGLSPCLRSHPPLPALWSLSVTAQQTCWRKRFLISGIRAPLCLRSNDYSTTTTCWYWEIISVIVMKLFVQTSPRQSCFWNAN